MQSSSPQIPLVAKEIDLTLAISCVRPCVVEHTPGIASQLADALSRRFQPSTAWRIPKALQGVNEHVPEQHTAPGYYICGG